MAYTLNPYAFIADPPIVPSNDSSGALPRTTRLTYPPSHAGHILGDTVDPSLVLHPRSHAIYDMGAPLDAQSFESNNAYAPMTGYRLQAPAQLLFTEQQFDASIMPPQGSLLTDMPSDDEQDNSTPLFLAPTNFVRVPQPHYREVERPRHSCDVSYRHAPIVFQVVGFPEAGVRLGKARGRNMPPIVGGSDQVFSHVSDREIKLRLIWPGYPDEVREKRVKTQSGSMDRNTLLLSLCNMFVEFALSIVKRGISAEPGFERWQIVADALSEPGIQGPELFITSLRHRGGANWQPEFYAPREQNIEF
ncbi:hypothetical protein AX16_002664 [Volvariella volvacea WC 439]|nr:hypothetical protein AX16_002664 [Volvariella volvacea WC 439]